MLLLAVSFAGNLQYDYIKNVKIPSFGAGFSVIDNPAAINWMPYSMSMVMKEHQELSVKNQTFSLALPFYAVKMGFLFKFDNIGGIQKTYQANDGTFKTESNINHSKFSAMFTLGNETLIERLFFGLNGKIYSQNIEDKSMFGFGWDAGLIYNFTPNFFAGISYNDIGNTTHKWNDLVTDQIDSSLELSLSYKYSLGSIGYSYNSKQQTNHIKTKFSFYNLITTAFSFPLENFMQTEASVQMNFDNFYIGYDMSFNETMGQESQFSVGMKLGEF